MNIGVIGYGNMGSMIVENILTLDLLLDDEKLMISNRNIEKLSNLKDEYDNEKLILSDDNTEIAKNCQKIIIAVKTSQFKEVMEEIKPHLNEETHIIHTCAGLDFKYIESFYDGKLSMFIPTFASKVSLNNSVASQSRRKGISLIKHNLNVTLEEKMYIEDLLNEFSYVKEFKYGIDFNGNPIESNEIEIATIICSCAPAFIATIIEKISESISLKTSMEKDEIEDMILKTILGTRIIKEDYDMSNKDIINTVATKGGITQEGVDYLNLEAGKISNKLLDNLMKRYDEVKQDLDQEYLNN